MPKANKEFILNYTANRWKLNSKRNVGPTSDSIRRCNPANLEEWKQYYYLEVRSPQQIDVLGHALAQHIKEDLPGEERFHPNLISSIKEQDCVNYMHKLVIERVYDGFKKERGLA